MQSAIEFQRQRIRAMSADEKLRVSHALWVEAWKIAEAGERARHPDWTDDQIAARVRELMRDATP